MVLAGIAGLGGPGAQRSAGTSPPSPRNLAAARPAASSWLDSRADVGSPLPVNPSINNAGNDVVRCMTVRAARQHRSVRGELLAILEEAVRTPPVPVSLPMRSRSCHPAYSQA